MSDGSVSSSSRAGAASNRPPLRSGLSQWAQGLACTLTVLLTIWCSVVCGVAIHPTALGVLLALLIVAALLAIGRFGRTSPFRSWLALAATFVATCLVATAVRPRADRDWAFEMGRTPSAEISGDTVTLRNFRNFAWRSATDADERWETRTFPLSQLRGVDLVMVYWGSPHMSHTMASFDFGDAGHVCVSIEARRERNEKYSPTLGAFRRYELLYVLGAESDLIRLRTNFRANQTVRVFPLVASPEVVRAQFLGILAASNAAHAAPAWYHTLTCNCTTEIVGHDLLPPRGHRWDWRCVANGHLDESLRDRGYIETAHPLAELRQRLDITARAREATEADFSRRIRVSLTTP